MAVLGAQELREGLMVTPSVRLVSPLGQGGMGSVWLAEHLSLRTRVVVKFMSGVLASSDDAKARFAREASAAAQVKSPHVVQMLDHGVAAGGAPYIVMEYLEGKDLSHHLAERRILPPEEVATIITQVGKALSRAHAAGILHRDIKPENIFLCDQPDGEIFAKLLDFGIAKALDDAVDNTTRTGSVVGTPSYMSPEQIVGAKSIDLRSDLWSLGVVAFDALTGQKPFRGETIGALAVEIHGALPMPSAINPSLPPALDGWFAKACAREPAARFASAKELAATLTAVVTGAPARAIMPSLVEASAHDVGVARTRSSTDAGTSVRVPPPARSRVIALAAIGVTVAVVAFVVVVAIAGRIRPSTAASVTSAMSASPSVMAAPVPPPSTLPVPDPAPSSSGLAATPSVKPSRRSYPAPSTSSRKVVPSHKIDNDDIK